MVLLTAAEEVGRLLRSSHRTCAVAESCTGGLICHCLTNVPGCSEYFLAGFVTYGNSSKVDVLGVAHKTIEDHGAVSSQTVVEMARGALNATGADVALAVSGIAGPGGGTPHKPVGLVFIAVADGRGTQVARHIFKGDRLAIKEQASEAAVNSLKEFLTSADQA